MCCDLIECIVPSASVPEEEVDLVACQVSENREPSRLQ